MTGLHVEKTNGIIEARTVNPYGAGDINILENYQPQSASNTAELEEQQYKTLQKAEANYFLASVNLNRSNLINQYNTQARQMGYNNVNLTHRHDVDMF